MGALATAWIMVKVGAVILLAYAFTPVGAKRKLKNWLTNL
jgi:hypothetical protein